MAVIAKITAVIEQVDGVKLLDVDPGASTNRTVVTFAGEPEKVIEAAFQAIAKAAEVIDMRKHTGTHPRMGATDVCPLIPIAGVTDEEAVYWANELGRRVGEMLKIPVYLYEKAAKSPERKNLAVIRAGEYEGFAQKITLPEWTPDYGPAVFNAQSGQTVIGVRDFLVAYNLNLNTRSVRKANSVAFDIREKGRVKTDNGLPWGKPVKDQDGNVVREPGLCKSVKAIGWYVEEYGFAQVSANLTDIQVAPVHEVFEVCRSAAERRGIRVTGSELVGMLPKKCLVDAGKFYLEKQGVSAGVSEAELIETAIQSLGLSQLAPFDPRKKIIEYQLEETGGAQLIGMTVQAFASKVASDAPAPGGGSVAGYVGALGVALGTMVSNLSANKRGWEEKLPFFSDWAVKGQELMARLMQLVDADTLAFGKVMEAYQLPRNNEAEIHARKEAIQVALTAAAHTPLAIMEAAHDTLPLLMAMAEVGNPNSITDAGVGAWCVRTAVEGAALNVKINLADITDIQVKTSLNERVNSLKSSTKEEVEAVLSQVDRVMGKN